VLPAYRELHAWAYAARTPDFSRSARNIDWPKSLSTAATLHAKIYLNMLTVNLPQVSRLLLLLGMQRVPSQQPNYAVCLLLMCRQTA